MTTAAITPRALPRGSVRLIDLLCDEHRHQATDCWPVFDTVEALFDQCLRCHQVRDPHLDPLAGMSVRVMPDFEPEVWEECNAFHEAAHTVGAVIAGHPIEQVSIARHASHVETAAAGGLALGDFSVSGLDHLAMVWAGHRAARRWLTLAGLDTPANLVDVCSQGIHDLIDIAQWTRKFQVPADTGRDQADQMLASHWEAVETIAAALCEEYVLPCQRIRDLLTNHHPQLADRIDG